jgi:DNA-binding CsgD family transcriptional regulator
VERDRCQRDTDPVAHRVSCPQLIGRADELDQLGDAFDQAADGRPAVVVVGGDAGIGKTRLLTEFGCSARDRGALVATGGCIPIHGEGLPYAPITGILRDLAQQLGTAAAELLGPLAQGLGLDLGAGASGVPADGYPGLPHLADELARTRLFESVLACLERLAERSVIVLVFEDLQWADSASAGLIAFLTRNLGDTRVLLVGTYRNEEVGRDHHLRPWLRELARQDGVTLLALEALGHDETAQMIEGILGHPPDWTLVDAVWARSEGNAFYTEELTASRHSPSLRPELRGVIMSRVEGSSPDAQQLLEVAATAGELLDHELLVAVSGLDAERLHAALAETIDRQILMVDPSQTGYRFRHALLREAVYAEILLGERRRLHRLMAEALTEDPSRCSSGPEGRTAELAVHWWAAGAWPEALEASMAAADTAIALWAFPEALAHLERALSALDRIPTAAAPTGTDRLELVEKTSDTAYLAGQGERSVELARQALDAVDAVSDPTRAARLHALLGRNTWSIGDSAAALGAYRQAAALLPTDAPSPALARILAEEARGLMMMSRTREAQARCHEAIDVARATSARASEGHALNTLGCCLSNLGHFDEAIVLMRDATGIAEEVGSPEDLNRALGNLGSLLVDSGRLEEAAALVFDSAAIGEELWGVKLEAAATNSSDALIRLGRYDEAEALLGQTGNRGLGACPASPDMARAEIAVRRGRFEDAERLLAAVDDLTASLSDVQQRGGFHMLRAELGLVQDRPDDAYEDIERALALAAGSDDEAYTIEMCALGVRALADRLDQARTRGERVDADKARLLALGLVEEADRLAAAPGERGGRCTARSAASATLSAAEESRLDTSDPDLWADAVGRWEVASERHQVAYCRWRESEALLERRGDKGRASQCLQQAWTISLELGALPLQERIERLAQRARITLADPLAIDEDDESTQAADLGLTPREMEVLAQLAGGRRDGEIAESLFISKKTASVHVSNILRKLDVANRIEAGRIGQAQGLG